MELPWSSHSLCTPGVAGPTCTTAAQLHNLKSQMAYQRAAPSYARRVAAAGQRAQQPMKQPLPPVAQMLEQRVERQLQAARRRAAERAAESCRQGALFVDPFAAALVDNTPTERDQSACSSGEYCVATHFIDQSLLRAVAAGGLDGGRLHQVVLLADGLDTRPYRLPWPPTTAIYDVSPASAFSAVTAVLQGTAATVPAGCLVRHVSAELVEAEDWRDEGWGEKLVRLGYQATQPSAWALQGLDGLAGEALQSVVGQAALLVAQGSVFVGELQLPDTTATSAEADGAQQELRELFGRNGFLVRFLSHADAAASLGAAAEARLVGSSGDGDCGGGGGDCSGTAVLFVAEQQRWCEAELEGARWELARAEDDDGEEGFWDAP
eukprot:SM000168S02599  [mRNA]  locus=s168:150699:152781:+ [translate_table: standard]